jgi:hypothetical protein
MINVFDNQYHIYRDLAFEPFDDPDPDPDPEVLFNPPHRTRYFGRGRHGDNERLHRAIRRPRPNPWF